jgi:hypothetical protein
MNLESGGFKARTKAVGINGNQCVPYVNQPHEQALSAIAAYKKTAWPENAEYFTKNLVLKFARRDMMKHSERDGSRKL